MSKLMAALMRNAGIAYGPDDKGGGAGGDGGGGQSGDGAGGAGDKGSPGGSGAGGAGDGDGAGGDGDKTAKEGAAKPGEKAGEQPPVKQDVAGDYVDDPKLSADDNAKAKEAHEKRREMFGAPEKFADVTVPEGMTLDQAGLDALHGFARTTGMSQKAVDNLLEIQKGIVERATKEQQEAWDATTKQWDADAKADKEIGGKDFDANMGLVAKARADFGTKEFNDWLDGTGFAGHPEMRRFLYRVGKAMGDGGNPLVSGSSAAAAGDAATGLYNHPTSKKLREKK